MKVMKVIQITASGSTVYGLGNDGKVYIWNSTKEAWCFTGPGKG